MMILQNMTVVLEISTSILSISHLWSVATLAIRTACYRGEGGQYHPQISTLSRPRSRSLSLAPLAIHTNEQLLEA
jgi:hypothetical protein